VFVARTGRSIRKQIEEVETMSGILKPGLIFLACSFLVSLSCEKNTTPLTQNSGPPIMVTLDVEDVTCTEAWLRLSVGEVPEQAAFQLLRNDSAVVQGELTTSDTLLYDESLLPDRNYIYQACVLKGEKRIASSEQRTATTMDTTSHDFQWETFEFPSPYGSARLCDVAIINENDIWAVGEIYCDTVQTWLPYNAVHWNGSEWELKRINFYLCPNGTSPTPYPIKALFAFSSDDIWFTRGASIVHWDGSNFNHNCQINSVMDGSINKLWGTDSNNLYAVGYSGTIVHYGSSWQKLESGTDLPITDIWGVEDSETGEPIVLCTATEKFDVSDHKIFKIGPAQGVSEINWPFADRRPYSVWFKTLDNLFICGDGVFRIDPIRQYQLFTGLPTFFKERIRGNDINDIYTAGDFGLLAHYNGLTWWTQPNSANDIFRGLDVKGNLAVAAGEKDHNAFIVMLTRE
jgi:hypothetical protein